MNNKQNKIFKFIVVWLLAILAMTGCGSKDSNNGNGSRYSMSGTVSGAVSQGVTITLSGAGTAATTSDASGNYTFSSLVNGSYNIVPSYTGYTFTPVSQAVTINGKSVTGINFTAGAVLQPPSSPTGLTATAGTQVAKLTWTTSVSATGYNIYITYTTNVQPTVDTTTAPPYIVRGLAIGTPYYFTVTAYNNVG